MLLHTCSLFCIGAAFTTCVLRSFVLCGRQCSLLLFLQTQLLTQPAPLLLCFLNPGQTDLQTQNKWTLELIEIDELLLLLTHQPR